MVMVCKRGWGKGRKVESGAPLLSLLLTVLNSVFSASVRSGRDMRRRVAMSSAVTPCVSGTRGAVSLCVLEKKEPMAAARAPAVAPTLHTSGCCWHRPTTRAAASMAGCVCGCVCLWCCHRAPAVEREEGSAPSSSPN